MTILKCAMAALMLALLSGVVRAGGDAARGAVKFQECAACHTLEAGVNNVGPSLHGIIGRKAASDPKFPSYTTALKGSGITWTEDKIVTFLSGPAKLVPGTAMPITLKKPEDRENIVAYLASVKK